MGRTEPRVGIGEFVREVRTEAGLSQLAFACAIRRHEGTVAAWETDRQMPGDEAIETIQRKFGVFLGALKESAEEQKTAARGE